MSAAGGHHRPAQVHVDYDAGLEQVLPALGIVDAFDPSAADFTGIGTSDAGPLFISRVLHKTHLEVDELGTKAAAATVVEMTEGAMEMEEPPKEVILDRPLSLPDRGQGERPARLPGDDDGGSRGDLPAETEKRGVSEPVGRLCFFTRPRLRSFSGSVREKGIALRINQDRP